MNALKTRSLEQIEERIGNIEEGSIRRRVLECARDFKTSWIELGQALYSVWKDKLYREWGYMTFEAYTAKEIGVKNVTAMKLLKSYAFLEKEEPRFITAYKSDPETTNLPQYESVNVLRLARNKKALDERDYETLKKNVLEKGKDVGEVRKELTAIIRQREDLSPEEAREQKQIMTLRRMVATLKALKREAELTRCLPPAVIKEAATLIGKIEAELA